MAKVIGHEPKLVKRCTCQNCAAIIEYTRSEIKNRFYKDGMPMTDEGRRIEGITCPDCKEFVRTNH